MKPSLHPAGIIASCFLFLLFSIPAFSAPGDFDTSFGTDGTIYKQLYLGKLDADAYATDIAILDDGTRVILGNIHAPYDEYYSFVSWVKQDNLLHRGYGNGGTTFPAQADHIITASALYLHTDGSYLVCGSAKPDGSSTSRPYLARLNSQGQFDTSFAQGGSVMEDNFLSDSAVYTACAVLTDGSVVAAGTLSSGHGKLSQMIVAKYSSHGALDKSFATDGVALITYQTSNERVYDMLAHSNGAVYVVGISQQKLTQQGILFRLDSDGSLTTKFGTAGFVVFDYSGSSSGVEDIAMGVQSDGKLLVAGNYEETSGNKKYFVSRVSTAGALDSGFGTGGTAEVIADCSATGSVFTDQAGAVFACGQSQNGPSVAKFDSSGQPDLAFGLGGYQVFDGDYDFYGQVAALDTNGNIIPAGYIESYPEPGESRATYYIIAADGTYNKYHYRFIYPSAGSVNFTTGLAVAPDGSFYIAGDDANKSFITRFTAQGILDSSFADSGEHIVYNEGDIEYEIEDIGLSSGGSLYFCGRLNSPVNDNFFIGRSQPPMTDFTIFGKDFQNSYEHANALAFQTDGRIIVVGESDTSFAVMRFLTNTATDPSFGTDGIALNNFSASTHANAAAVQNDGKIVVCGNISDMVSTSGYTARFNSDGSLDTTYGSGNGYTVNYLGGSDNYQDLEILPDGKILAVGKTEDSLLLTRFNSDGSLDTDFGTGSVVHHFGTTSATAMAVEVDAGGKIYLAGALDSQAVVWRCNADGSLDTSFGADGVSAAKDSLGSAFIDMAILDSGRILAAGYAFGQEIVYPAVYQIDMYAAAFQSTSAAQDYDVTGWWYTPNEGGTGLSIGMSADKSVVFLAWYVYDASGKAIWYVAWCGESGTNTYTGDVRRYVGSPLGTFTDEGDITLSFSDANSGTLTWNMSVLRANPGTKIIESYMPGLDSGSDDPAGFNGWWADASGHPATGIFVEAKGSTMYLGRYYYRADGTPVWEVMGGFLDQGGFNAAAGTYTAEVMEISGGQTVGGNYSPPAVPASGKNGTLTFSQGGNSMTFTCDGEVYNLSPYTITMP